MDNNSINISASAPVPPTVIINDHAEMLDHYRIPYTIIDYYIQVGEISHIQGWILHISTVIYQVDEMLDTIIPFLAAEKIPFKIARDKEAAFNLLNGALGTAQLGKLVSIYPPNDVSATQIAQQLVLLTQQFNGPRILTDIHLGGAVYTRYGSCNPLFQTDENDQKRKYIYHSNGQLIIDNYTIPFRLPEGITWPFSKLAKPTPTPPKKVFGKIYKPISLLKTDVRGNVYKGIYVKGLFRTASCVIKEGKSFMVSEYTGRDIRDRLLWQREVYQQLSGVIPMPPIIDLFEQDGDTYLVIEFIKGISLENRLRQLTFDRTSWKYLPDAKRDELITYLLKILSIIESLHENGYVHRDIQPANFLLNENRDLLLIDLELSYSLKEGVPDPPFLLGTPGYMSPEQQCSYIPTVKEDIYGLGALMLSIFTGLSPLKFDTTNEDTFKDNVYFFTGDVVLSETIATCLRHEPEERPALSHIKHTIQQHVQALVTGSVDDQNKPTINSNQQTIKDVITRSINGLVNHPTILHDELWYSKELPTGSAEDSSQLEYAKYPGLKDGITGILYLLSKVKVAGFDIDSCLSSYQKGWSYINDLSTTAAGLYDGAPGIALSLAAAIDAGLLEDTTSNRNKIQTYLQVPCRGLDISNGASGAGLAALSCIPYLAPLKATSILKTHISVILSSQQKDGSWILPNSSGDKDTQLLGVSTGISGILFFLLAYLSHYEDPIVKNAVQNGVTWIIKKTNNLNDLFDRGKYKELIGPEQKTGDERTGIILTFIKSYEVLQDETYKYIAEAALRNYPAYVVNNNFSQHTGLAGLGEMYLEAWRVFGSAEWYNRARWIADIFIHTKFAAENGSYYWQLDGDSRPLANLLEGSCGIIHFLLRMLAPTQIGYRILS